MRFHGTSWQKVPEAPSWLDLPIKMLNADEGTRETVQILLNDTCPQFVRGLLEAGKPDLEKQGQPAIFTLVLHLDPSRFFPSLSAVEEGQGPGRDD